MFVSHARTYSSYCYSVLFSVMVCALKRWAKRDSSQVKSEILKVCFALDGALRCFPGMKVRKWIMSKLHKGRASLNPRSWRIFCLFGRAKEEGERWFIRSRYLSGHYIINICYSSDSGILFTFSLEK